MEPKHLTPHILVFPFPAISHINPMLKFAELLRLSGIHHVTFLNTESNHERLVEYTGVDSRFSQLPGFHFRTIKDHMSSGSITERLDNFSVENTIDLPIAIQNVLAPAFREFIVKDSKRINEDLPHFTCIIGDGLLNFTIDIAKEIGIPNMMFYVSSSSCIWTLLSTKQLLKNKVLPLKDDNMDLGITCVPGMENFLRGRDLPSFLRVKEVKDLEDVCDRTHKTLQASAFIINTMEELEESVLSHIESFLHGKAYTIGPLDALLNLKKSSTSFPSLRAVDRSCLTWLDSQSSKSVVYVSFGSTGVVSKQQLLEFWHGIVYSRKPFLWAMRPGSIIGEDEEYSIPDELLKATRERGCMVEWCPQQEVLEHPSVGGFLTHAGWNSVLEAITAGVPMLCWPYFTDQLTISRYVSAVWKNGIDMKDTCDRSIIEKMVRELMGDRREELVKSSEKLAEMAKGCVKESGSSFRNFDCLVNNLKSFSI